MNSNASRSHRKCCRGLDILHHLQCFHNSGKMSLDKTHGGRSINPPKHRFLDASITQAAHIGH